MKLSVSFIALSICMARAASNTGQFWHVTDLHVDDRYSTEGNPDFMCWEVSTPASRSPGMFGDYLCDSPQLLIESAVDAMAAINPQPDFIMWTGDDTTHVNDSFFSTEIVFNVINVTTEAIRSRFPDTSVIPVIGNHDLYPQNQVLNDFTICKRDSNPYVIKRIEPGKSELQTLVADLWKNWLDRFDAYNSFESLGSFVANIPGTNISVVAINTLLWYEYNDFTKLNETLDDPGNLFLWMDQALKFIEQHSKKAYIMGHIPPGFFERYFDSREGFHWYQPRYNTKFIELINKYASNTIAAQFYGHHHTDSFRVFTNDADEPLSYALIAPGVTPLKSTLTETAGANNPGVRLVTYDRDTGEIIESTTYYLDLKKANQLKEANWVLEYDLKSILNIEKINANTLYEAAVALKTNDTFFYQYYPVNTVQVENATTCDETCRLVQYCSMVEIDYDAYYDCNGSFNNFLGTSMLVFCLLCSYVLIAYNVIQQY